MISGIRPIVNFFIYSSIVISLAASTFTLETFLVLKIPIDLNYLGLVFFATILTYSVHRIVGIRKLDEALIEGRFKVIRQFKSHIFVYTLVSFFTTVYFLTQLPNSTLVYLAIPAIISSLYTIPLLSKSKRLRDFDYIKIILIALTWSSVALIGIVKYDLNQISILIIILMLIEKCIYIFAITLPFDIRDETIDKHSDVKTFPTHWGQPKTYRIIRILLLVCMLLTVVVSFSNGLKPLAIVMILMAYGFSYWAVNLSRGKRSDLYYSGMLDGMIIVRSLLIAGGFYYFS